MILCTHAIAGAALASFVPSHPVTAFVAGFASHFILDAIPHWDYPIRSRSVNPRIGAPMTYDGALLRDMLSIGSDGVLGIVLAVFLFASPTNFWAILLGAIGAMLPDPLQFVYTRLPYEPLRTLQRFHCWAHSKIQIKSPVRGAAMQAAFAVAVIAVTITLHTGILDSAFATVPATTP
jgi:Zn-dependent protease with chaperone function